MKWKREPCWLKVGRSPRRERRISSARCNLSQWKAASSSHSLPLRYSRRCCCCCHHALVRWKEKRKGNFKIGTRESGRQSYLLHCTHMHKGWRWLFISTITIRYHITMSPAGDWWDFVFLTLLSHLFLSLCLFSTSPSLSCFFTLSFM